MLKHLKRLFLVTPERVLIALLLVEVFLFLSDRYDWFWFNQYENYTVLVVVAIVAIVLAAIATWAGVSWLISRWKGGKPFQFGLQSLLLLVAVVAIVCWWFPSALNDNHLQAQVAAKMDERERCASHDGAPPPIPFRTLLEQLGVKFFPEVVGAGGVDDDDCDDISHFRNCRTLVFISSDDEFPRTGTTVTDQGLARLKSLTQLRSLEIDSPHITSLGLRSLSRNAHLETMYLHRAQVDDDAMKVLGNFPNLKGLAINASHSYDALLWAQHRPVRFESADLERAKLQARLSAEIVHWNELGYESGAIRDWGVPKARSNSVTDEGLVHLSGLHKIEQLSLNGFLINGTGLRHMASAKRLWVLRLNDCPITDEGLAKLQAFPKLAEVDLMNTSITDAGLAHLASHNALNSLSLDGTALEGSGLSHLTNCALLHHLSLGSTKITDEALSHAGSVISLRSINLRDTQISDAGLSHLQNLSGLQSIILSATQINGEGLIHLKQLPSLTHLDLRETTLSDEAYAHIAEMDKLTDLYLDFSSTTDAQLALVGKVKNLQRLHLDGTGITDAGLEHLKGRPKLMAIWVHGTKVTPNGAAELLKTLSPSSRVNQ
jgi:internalin A